MIARWNKPFARGIDSSVLTFAPPPDSPNTVTLPGSPPNAVIFSRTHSSAATMSSVPALPDNRYASPPTADRSRCPKMFSRWLTATTTTSFRAASRDPRVRGELAFPYANAPPWNQTITGRFAASQPGVQTFTVRQSSVSGEPSAAPEKFSSSGRVAGRNPA